MRTKLKERLVALGRAGRNLLRWFFLLPLALARFVVRLPGRLWRGLKRLARAVIHLPGRVWRGLQTTARFIRDLPRRFRDSCRRAFQRLTMALKRTRLRIREGRARIGLWWRTRVLPPRTASPRTQVLALVTLMGTLYLAYLVGVGLVSARRDPTSESVVVTAAPPATSQPAATPLPTRAVADVADSEPFGGGGAVAFSLRRDGNTDIYVRKLDQVPVSGDQVLDAGDNGALLRLTYHPAEDREPAWAPDGETMAFVSHRGGNWDIYRMDLLSGVMIRLTRHPHYEGNPSWSPDGAFIAFESYRSGNLDIFIMAADGSEVQQLTADSSADFSPAWSPDGRHIAFVSYRDGSKDIFLYPLDAGSEAAVINLTRTPDRDEDAPSWSPDGSRLAFSVGRFGAETIYITTFDWSSKFLDEAQTQLFNPGRRPAWSPDGSSLIYQYQRGQQEYLIADSVTVLGAGREVFHGESQPQDPSWGAPTIDPQIVAAQRANAPIAAALYLEEVLPIAESGPPHTIVALEDVNGGDDREFLSDRVNDSFQALRQRVLQETGTDYLANIGDSFRAIMVEPPPGQSPRSWHKAGRAFDLNQGLYEREENVLEVVREDIGFRTYWRIYLRAARQDGSLGAPLHQAPWDLKARGEGGLAAREGGEQEQEVPLGYYVDFTLLAADYGWERMPANTRWRQQWADTNWWQFQKSQGLTWFQAMLELYREDQIEAVFGPIADEEPVP
jgi:TolB protein